MSLPADQVRRSILYMDESFLVAVNAVIPLPCYLLITMSRL